MSAIPPPEVVDAINDGRITSLRRTEFYQADGSTLWLPTEDEPISRLTGGSVNVDSSRDERRAGDFLFDNSDGALRPNSEDGLWYDKVIKAYRGVRYAVANKPPRIAIIHENAAGNAVALRTILYSLGFTDVDIKLSAATSEELTAYEIIISHGASGAAAKTGLLNTLYQTGKKIMTTGNESTPTDVPLIATVASTAVSAWGIDHMAYDTPVNDGWSAESQGSESGRIVTAVTASATAVAKYLDGATTHYTGIIEEHASGGRWFHYAPHTFGTQAKILLDNALNWLWNYQPFKEWITQIGEFVIDNLSEDHFPHIAKVTCRDYTKRCLTSKLERITSFSAGTPIRDLILAVGANAGVSKFDLPQTDATLSERLDFDRGTERWRVMKGAADSANLELYFDPQGYLTMREYLDPAYSPVSQTFFTGAGGNLISWSRSVNDSRLYNHIVITGETSEENALPFFGEAINNEPNSPTNVDRIGDRPYFYTSSFFTSNEQCQDLARSWLKLKSLESYEISWGTLVYPWLEAGSIVEFLDPARLDNEPTRFLLDTLNISMELAPMGSTGKRVTFVEDSTLVGA